ncbi:MAG: hypothetical protein ACTSRK_02615 [Promethearchaeota archaeon]
MSAISSKKSEQQEGPEKILFYMGIVFIAIDIVISFLAIIFSWNFYSTNVMALLIYFLILSGLSFGFGSILKESAYSKKLILNWYYGLFAISIILGVVLGSYKW